MANNVRVILVLVAVLASRMSWAGQCDAKEVSRVSDGGVQITMTTGEVYRVALADRLVAELWSARDLVDVCPGFDGDALVNREKRETVSASLFDE